MRLPNNQLFPIPRLLETDGSTFFLVTPYVWMPRKPVTPTYRCAARTPPSEIQLQIVACVFENSYSKVLFLFDGRSFAETPVHVVD